jgi:hypothetical protein
VRTLRTIPILPTPFYSMIQTRFIVRAKDVSVASLVKGIGIQIHSHLPLYRMNSPPTHGVMFKRPEHLAHFL